MFCDILEIELIFILRAVIYKVVFIVIYFPKNPNIVEFSENVVLLYQK
jgi:hypothetical protein